MKKRVFSLILSILVLLSCFAPCAFAESSDNFGQVSPDPNCEHDWKECDFSGWEYEWNNIGIGVDVQHCDKCNVYKHTFTVLGCKFNYYSLSGLKGPNGEFGDFVTYNLAKIIGHVGNFIIANTPSSDFNAAKDLPGYEDDEGTAQVSKEGKLTFVAIPRWLTFEGDSEYFLTPRYEDYHYEVRKPTYSFDHDYDFTCVTSVVRRFTETTYGKNTYGLRIAQMIIYWEVEREVPGTYYLAANQMTIEGYCDRLGGTLQNLRTSAKTLTLPSDEKTNRGKLPVPYAVYHEARDCRQQSTDTNVLTFVVHSLIVTCDPTENTITPKDTVTIGDNTFTGKIYEDSDTDLTYIYPEYSTTGDDGDTITVVPDHPLIYNYGSDTYYIYDNSTKNYYYLDYTPQVTPTPSPTPSPTPVVTPTPSPEPVVTPTPTPVVTPTPSPEVTPTPTPDAGNNDHCDHTGIIAVLEQIRDKMVAGFTDITANIHADMVDFKAAVVAGFTDITTNITSVVADFKAAVVAGFADLSANFQLAIDNLNINIQNFFNKKMEDLPEPTPEPSEPTPSPAPTEPLAPILPETQNLIIPKMNSNTFTDEHGTWIASGSSKYSDVFDFFRAFDRSTSEIWETNVSPSHLQIEIPDPENYYIDGYIMRISKFDNRYAKDWTLQGSDDGETWDDLDTQKGQNLSDKQEHKYSLTLRKAYKYYRLNMSNYASSMCSLSHFNLLGYDAKDVVTPTPSPSPAPDPGATPMPTPAPTDKPSGGDKTNNFWTIIFPSGGDDSSGEHKGIFWALVSLILALIAFFTNLSAGIGYLFPFLPDGVVMTFKTCLFVVFLFTIIKFVMRSK